MDGTIGRAPHRLDFDDPASLSKGYGMRPVIRFRFGENALEMAFDCLLRDREPIGDKLVRIVCRDQVQDRDFPGCE